MAEGSQKFQWNLFGDSPHVCRRCKRTLRVQDVAEERHLFPSNRYEFLCVTCKRSDVEAMIQRNRESLGLQTPAPSARS